MGKAIEEADEHEDDDRGGTENGMFPPPYTSSVVLGLVIPLPTGLLVTSAERGGMVGPAGERGGPERDGAPLSPFSCGACNNTTTEGVEDPAGEASSGGGGGRRRKGGGAVVATPPAGEAACRWIETPADGGSGMGHEEVTKDDPDENEPHEEAMEGGTEKGDG